VTFAANDTQNMIADTVRRLLAAENGFESRRHRLSAATPDRLALWPKFAALGITATLFGEAYGGFGGTPRDAAVVLYEIGRSLAVEPYLATLAAGRILLAAAPPQAKAEIESLLAGGRITVLAHPESLDPAAPPCVRATSRDGAFHLDGEKPAVRHADIANRLIVTARIADTGALGCFLVDSTEPSLRRTPQRLIDAASGAQLHFERTPARLLLHGAAAQAALDDALAWTIAGLGAEAAGIAEALVSGTAEYLRTRKQFGVTLANFQALQHRLADMHIAAQELRAIVETVLDQMATGAGALTAGLVSALKVILDRAGRKIGHEAVQLHGGMGVSDELNISHYMRRLACIRAEAGGEAFHLSHFAAIAARANRILWFDESPEAAANRAEVKRFVQENLPRALARKVEIGLELEKHDYTGWEKILRAHGWFGVAWPQEHGGAGWGLERQLAFIQEAALNSAPMVMPYGVNMVGPVLQNFGTAAQQQKYLPDILSSRTWWCQGYSEPNSGSDLASLKTFAARDGDEYIINGTKMWTTQAHWADMMHCLVRTSRDGRQQEGITFLLIDMKTPGITVRPIITNDGQHHTNQTFFDNVRVPVANRVGEEGDGWKIAKFLLANERIAIADTGPKLKLLRDVKAIFARAAALPSAMRETYALRIADLEIQLAVLCMVERRYISAWANGASRDGPEASLLKIRGTEILQHIAELALDLEGPLGMVHDPADLHLPVETQFTPAQHASMMANHYLYSRCWSIFGGTNEVQRNIIARFALAS
jgi:alkylation response protein AidB-like acyl-CoA dehydrogenase